MAGVSGERKAGTVVVLADGGQNSEAGFSEELLYLLLEHE